MPATGQVDFSDVPSETVRRLPRRPLPVAILAWLGTQAERQGQGLGRLPLAHAHRDCYNACRTFVFIAVILDCNDEAARAFYQRHDFQEIAGHPYRQFLSTKHLQAMMDP